MALVLTLGGRAKRPIGQKSGHAPTAIKRAGTWQPLRQLLVESRSHYFIPPGCRCAGRDFHVAYGVPDRHHADDGHQCAAHVEVATRMTSVVCPRYDETGLVGGHHYQTPLLGRRYPQCLHRQSEETAQQSDPPRPVSPVRAIGRRCDRSWFFVVRSVGRYGKGTASTEAPRPSPSPSTRLDSPPMRLHWTHWTVTSPRSPDTAWNGHTSLTGIAVLMHRRHGGGDLLRDVLTYLVHLTEPLTAHGEVLPGWWCGDGPGSQPSHRWPGGHGIAVIQGCQLNPACRMDILIESRETRPRSILVHVARGGSTSSMPRATTPRASRSGG
jgi:hypothetical protein